MGTLFRFWRRIDECVKEIWQRFGDRSTRRNFYRCAAKYNRVPMTFERINCWNEQKRIFTYFKTASSNLIPLTIRPFVLLLSTNLILCSPPTLNRISLAWMRLIMLGFKVQSNNLSNYSVNTANNFNTVFNNIAHM